jgi:hypothetical protein
MWRPAHVTPPQPWIDDEMHKTFCFEILKGWDHFRNWGMSCPAPCILISNTAYGLSNLQSMLSFYFPAGAPDDLSMAGRQSQLGLAADNCSGCSRVLGSSEGPLVMLDNREVIVVSISFWPIMLERRKYSHWDPLLWPLNTFYHLTLALTSLTSSGSSVGIDCSRTKVTEFSFLFSLVLAYYSETLFWLHFTLNYLTRTDDKCGNSS